MLVTGIVFFSSFESKIDFGTFRVHDRSRQFLTQRARHIRKVSDWERTALAGRTSRSYQIIIQKLIEYYAPLRAKDSSTEPGSKSSEADPTAGMEDLDIRDREVLTRIARHWYSKASDKALTTGRLYHHLAILVRSKALQQLFYNAKSLCVVIPLTSALESILTLFDPVFNTNNHQSQYKLPPRYVSCEGYGLLFILRISSQRALSPRKRNLLDYWTTDRKSDPQVYGTGISHCSCKMRSSASFCS